MASEHVQPGAPDESFGPPGVLGPDGLDSLVARLVERGYDVRGPVVRDGAIVPGSVTGVTDLPRGVCDAQSPGDYRLVEGGDDQLFAWAVGPGSWKAEFFPPSQQVWRSTRVDDVMHFTEPVTSAAPLAILGARPCDVAALDVLDRVLGDGVHPDPHYAARREGAFVAVVECASPAGTCFCSSMGTGPGVERGFDLALTEIVDPNGHRFVVRAGSTRGREILNGVAGAPATHDDLEARRRGLDRAGATMTRRLETEGLAQVLARNTDHPRWADVAERCLACANCTLVCPTCFCSDVRDTTELSGAIERRRTWSSCFDMEHSYLHGGPVRASVSSRYRQWMTHKLSTWWDQFDTMGCVGCGRCIAWCPVGIDLTEEASHIAASDGATLVSVRTREVGP